MTHRPTHRVSVKIALFNQNEDAVLMTILPQGGFGLPGGHVEGLEQPDEALYRELHEELGLKDSDYYDIEQRKFWREDDGDRIILGYVGKLDKEATITPDPEEVIGIQWVTHDEIADGKVSSRAYNDYLLEVLSKKVKN